MLLFHGLCVQVLLDLQLWLEVLLLVSLCLKCHALVKKKKEMHILWCFIVKGCVKRPARFRTLIFFFHSRVVVVFLSTHNQMEIQRARHVDRACWSFFQLRPFVKGSRNSGKHLWPVQVAHIRPLCCRCVGLLPPTEFHSAMQSVTLF